MHRGRMWGLAAGGVFVVGLLVAAVVVVGGDESGAPAPTTTTAATTTERASTVTTSTTEEPTTTAPRTTTTSRTATDPTVPVPGAVVATAHSGGGSGEVLVDWNAVPRATGYRVLRVDTVGGQARVVADFDITTGRTTAAAEVVTLWSEQHSYVPDRGPLGAPDRSPWFQYIDYLPGKRCYQVQAYNGTGDGQVSAVTCGAPIGDEIDLPGPAPSR